MKKNVIFALIVICAAFLFSCGEDTPQDLPLAHQCEWSDWETVTEASCTAQGKIIRHCKTCDEEEVENTPMLEHTPVYVDAIAPDCENTGSTESAYCSVCSAVLQRAKSVAALGHDYQGGNTILSTCKEHGTVTEIKCTRCKDVYQEAITLPLASHTYSTETVAATCKDGGYDIHTCTECTESYKDNFTVATAHTPTKLDGTIPTCTSTGLTEGSYCSACGTVILEQKVISATGHTESAIAAVLPTCESVGYTEGCKCLVCDTVLIAPEEIPSLTHTYTEEVIPATCREQGYTAHTCSLCNHTYNDTFTDRLQHIETVIAGHPATCTATGLTDGKYCTQCKTTTVEQTLIPANGHKEKNVAGKLPTCTEAGISDRVSCTACGEVLLTDKILDPLGHEYNHTVINPTCTLGGHTDHSCARCGNSYQDTFTAEKGHNTLTIPYTAPTCTADGATEGSYCGDCGTVFVASQKIEAIGHTVRKLNALLPTCHTTGLTEGYDCSVCGTVIEKQNPVAKLDHDYVGVSTAATCTTGGYTSFTCSICESSYVGGEVAALGHAEHVIKGKAATCTESGISDGLECSRCQVIITEQSFISALGHTHKTVAGRPATCTESGLTDGVFCSVCSVTVTSQEIITPKGHTEITIPASMPTCYANGHTESKVCGTCNTVIVESEVIYSTGHSYVSSIVPATCTENGYTLLECQCGAKQTNNFVGSSGHSIGEWHLDEESGRGVRSCANCDLTIGISSISAEYIYQYHNYVGEYVSKYMLSVNITTTSGSTSTISNYEIVDSLLDEAGTDSVTVKFYEHEVSVAIPVLHALLPNTTPSSYFTYEEKNGEITITGYTGPITDVVIPSFIGRIPVTAIKASAFKNNATITSVEIPGSIKTIGYSAFSGCSSLVEVTLHEGISTINYGAFMNTPIKKITIPNSVTAIKSVSGTTNHGAFEECTSLTEVIIGDSLAVITADTFRGCSALTTVTLGDSVSTIEGYAFAYCTSLSAINFGKSLDSTLDYSFTGCTSLVSVSLPSSLVSLGKATFYNCTSLKNVSLNEGLTSIGASAFEGCTALDSIVCPSTLQTIGATAFQNCEGLTSITLNDGLITINYGAFMESGLETVTIPDSVTAIKSVSGTTNHGAFEDCTSLTEVIIGDSLAVITADTFRGCSALTTVTLGDSVSTIEGYAFGHCTSLSEINFGKSLNSTLDYSFTDCTSLVSVSLPSSLVSLGKATFYSCTSLKNVSLNEGLTSIGAGAFENCYAIESIVCPSTLQGIGNTAFAYCTALSSIKLNDGITTISCGAFMHSGLKTVTIPDSVTTMKSVNGTLTYGAFEDCTSLTEVIIGDSLAVITADTFRGCSSLKTVIIGDSVTVLETYSFYNCTSLTDVTFGATVNTIDALTFGNCTSLKNLYLNEGLTTIGKEAFSGCNSISSLTLPSTVQSIEAEAFYNCRGLTSITLNEGLITIGYGAFMNSALTSIKIPDSVTTMKSVNGILTYGAFEDCTALLEVIIGNSLATITEDTFRGCSSLKTVIMGDGVTVLESYAFADCISLKDIYFSANLRTIGNYCFKNCRALTQISLPDTVQTVGEYAFDGCTSLDIVYLSYDMQSIGQYAFRDCSALDTVTLPGNRLATVGKGVFYNCDELKRLYYGGNENDWSNVTINENNDYPLNVTPYYYSKTQPTAEGNYWYYGKDNTELVWNVTKSEVISDSYTNEYATGVAGSDNSYVSDYVSELAGDVGFVASVTAWETLHIVTSPSYLLEDGVISRRDMYKIAIFDVLGVGDGDVPLIFQLLEDERTQLMLDIFEDVDLDIYSMSKKELGDTLKSTKTLGDIADEIDAIIIIANTAEEAFDSIIKYRAIMSLRDKFEVILNEIANDTKNDADLRNAAKDCVEIMQAGCDEAMLKMINVETLDHTLNALTGYISDAAWDALIGMIPGGNAIMLVGKGIRVLGNELFNMDEFIQAYYVMDSTMHLERAIRRCIVNGTIDPLRYENDGTAANVLNAAEMLEKTLLKGYDYAINFATAYGDSERAVEIAKEKMAYEAELNQYRASVESQYQYYYAN